MKKTKYQLCSYIKECWTCNKPIKIYYIEGENPDDNKNIATWLLKNVPAIKKQFSRTMGKETVANQCPHCKALQGNWFVYMDEDMIARMNNEYEITVEKEFEL